MTLLPKEPLVLAFISGLHCKNSNLRDHSFSDVQSCAALFPWSPLLWLVSGGIGAGLGYLIGDTFFATNAATATALVASANATNAIGDFAANATDVARDFSRSSASLLSLEPMLAILCAGIIISVMMQPRPRLK